MLYAKGNGLNSFYFGVLKEWSSQCSLYSVYVYVGKIMVMSLEFQKPVH